MSTVYASEPATSGRVILETTHGPLDIQLWCRECPTTTRLFLQLCLDGFYDDMLFHRIQPKFIIQTGAMRKKGQSSSAVDGEKMKDYRHAVNADHALERRKYEVHSRLRFNHRGQVAMALGVETDDDVDNHDVQPQFFITLDEASFIDGKHVLFGTVSGPTVFNALRIGSVDVNEETNQPTDLEHAPRIQSVRIVDNPIHQDIVIQSNLPWKQAEHELEKQVKKKKKRKGKRDLNVLSFGDEMEEETGGDVDSDRMVASRGIKSSHDVIESRGVAKHVNKEGQGSVATETNGKPKPVAKQSLEVLPPSSQQDGTIEPTPAAESVSTQSESQTARVKPVPAEASVARKVEEARPVETNPTPLARPAAVSIVELRKAKYARGRKDKIQRETDTMAKLLAFQTKVKEKVSVGKASSLSRSNDTKDNSLASRMARRAQEEAEPANDDDNALGPAYHGQLLEHNDDNDDDNADNNGGNKGDWLQTRFKCRRHMDHGTMESSSTTPIGGDGRNMNDYEVVDDREKRDGGHDNKNRHHHHHSKRHKKHHHDRRDREDGGR